MQSESSYNRRGGGGRGGGRGGRGGGGRSQEFSRRDGDASNEGHGGRGGRGGRAGRGGSSRGHESRGGRGAGGSYRGRGGGSRADNHSRPVISDEHCNGLLPKDNDNTEDPSKTNQNLNSKLVTNVFGLELSERRIFRHIVQMRLLDNKSNKNHILTTMSSRGRGNRASRQDDNFILLGKLLDEFAASKKDKKKPVYAYDGAQSLFSLEGISMVVKIQKEDAIQIPGISEFLKDSIKFIDGELEIRCDPDLDKPSFVQNEVKGWSDPRFYAYLDIVTSQSAIRSGRYLSQSKGLYVNTTCMKELRVKWAVAAEGVHKGCRIIGNEHPVPILELDPQSTQYYAPHLLNVMLDLAFPKEFSSNRPINPNLRLQRAVKLLLKDLKCNAYYEDILGWGTNTVTVSDVDYDAPKDPKYRQKYPKLKFPNLPAAVCGQGPNKKTIPMEYLRVLPYQTIDRRVLEEFELTPRANDPDKRWSILQTHFKQFGFNDEVMKQFGVRIQNDPFKNINEIEGERVTAPKIAYDVPVRVDDQKRDWKAPDKKFAKAATIDYLVFVLVAGYSRNFAVESKATEYIAHSFMERCKEKGMKIQKVEFKCSEGEEGSEQFLNKVFGDILKYLKKEKKEKDSSFIPFVLLVSDDVPNIHECLKFEERMSDIPTQHILLKTVRKMHDNIEKKSQGGRRGYDLTLDNIVMKANIKCGGLNYTADIPRDLECWSETPTFVMGMDVAHPDRMSAREGSPSTVGLSCTSAHHPYSFIGDFIFTDPKREAIKDKILRNFTEQNVRNFAEIRGFPKKIIIFRDGVSGGEEEEALREVKTIEEAIISAAKAMGLRDYAPKVLAMVVKKRHHTRFYAKGGDQGDTPINPLPDTSMGGEIAEYGKRQIFIQAFRPIQGTAKVPSFVILRDDEELSDEHIARMICAVCSLHQIVNSPTSIPTPIFVAHELAKRGTGLYKAYRFKMGELNGDWDTLTEQLSYSNLDRLSKVRVV